MNAKPQPVLCVGIDWADQEHVCCLMSSEDDCVVVETLQQQSQDIAAWVDGLAKRYPRHRVMIALEQSRGALIAALAEFTQLELYPINPKQLSSYREAISPSGAKDDPGDARLLAEFLKKHRHQVRRWQPDAMETRRIAELCELRRKLVDERKRLVLQLTSSLKLYFPVILTLAGTMLHDKRFLDLLRRWPTLEQLKRAKPQTLRRFLAEHGLKNEDQQTEFIQTARTAVPLTRDKAIIEPRAMYVQMLVVQIRNLNQALADFDDELQQAVATHQDASLFRALPGAGDALVPRLIAAFGSDRERYESAEQLQSYSGIAPVTRKSGKSHTVQKRICCPKFLRQTFHEFADHARRWSPWSKAFYRMKRNAGVKHHAAVRALAYKWIRIMFRLWKTNTIYSEAHYIRELTRRNSPVIQFLENGGTS